MQCSPSKSLFIPRSKDLIMKQNENYSPKIEMTAEGTTSLTHCLQRLLKVEGKKEIDRRKEREREDNISTFGKKANKDYYEKS